MVLFVINRDLSLWASHNIFQSNFPTKLIIISSLVLQEKKKQHWFVGLRILSPVL